MARRLKLDGLANRQADQRSPDRRKNRDALALCPLRADTPTSRLVITVPDLRAHADHAAQIRIVRHDACTLHLLCKEMGHAREEHRARTGQGV